MKYHYWEKEKLHVTHQKGLKLITRLHTTSLCLCGEQEYHQGQHSFGIPIPSDTLNEKNLQQKSQEQVEE